MAPPGGSPRARAARTHSLAAAAAAGQLASPPEAALRARAPPRFVSQAIPKDQKPWGRDSWGEPTPRPDDFGLEQEEEAKAWIAKREEAVRRFRAGEPPAAPAPAPEAAEDEEAAGE